MKVLISAFEPFGGRNENITAEVLKNLPEPNVILPVVFSEAWSVLKRAIDRHSPDFVLALGEFAGDSITGGSREQFPFRFERVALNIQFARISDNHYQIPIDLKISLDGPPAHFSQWPTRDGIEKLVHAGHSVTLSYHAGTFVCNHVFYQLLDNQKEFGYQGAFLHIAEEAQVAEAVSLIETFLNFTCRSMD